MGSNATSPSPLFVGSLRHGHPEFIVYMCCRVLMLLVTACGAAYSALRLSILVRQKLWRLAGAARQKSASAPSFDAQLQILTLSFVGQCLGCLSWVDIFSVEGIFSPDAAGIILQAAGLCSLLPGTRTLVVFIDLHARFHPPSKLLARSFWWIFLVLLIAAFVCYGLLVATGARSFELARFGIATGVGALSVLRPPTDPTLLRVQSAVERQSRARLLRYLRCCQAIVLVAAGAGVWNAIAGTIGSGGLQIILSLFVIDTSFSLICLGTAVIMGRSQAAQASDDSANPTTAGGSVKVTQVFVLHRFFTC